MSLFVGLKVHQSVLESIEIIRQLLIHQLTHEIGIRIGPIISYAFNCPGAANL